MVGEQVQVDADGVREFPAVRDGVQFPPKADFEGEEVDFKGGEADFEGEEFVEEEREEA